MGLDHLIAVDGVEESVYNPNVLAERQIILALLDGSVKLAVAVGTLLGLSILF